jgi:hypothetical protein
MMFAVPSGAIAAATAFAAYYAALTLENVDGARVDATTALFMVAVSERPLNTVQLGISRDGRGVPAGALPPPLSQSSH